VRYALRNQKKIKTFLGVAAFNAIIKSLNAYFKLEQEIELEKTDTNYQAIRIPNTEKEGSSISFYVIRKTFDVYNLAFKP